MIFLATFQLTLGTYSWVYLSQVACEEGLSLATFILWVAVLIITLTTGPMFDVMKPAGVFGFFSVSCILSFVYFFIFLKETKGLSRDESQCIYDKQRTVKGLKASLDTTEEQSLMDH